MGERMKEDYEQGYKEALLIIKRFKKEIKRLKERVAYLEEWKKYLYEQTLLEKNVNQNATISSQMKEIKELMKEIKDLKEKMKKR